jgi:hypothetical protein
VAAEPRPWPPAVLDTPRRHLGRAGFRDLLLLLPLVVAAIVAGVAVGRSAALPLLAAAILVRPVLFVTTGTTPGLRREGITLIRAGGGNPAWWRPFLWHVLPFLLLVPFWFLDGTDLQLLGFVPFVGVYVIGWWRGRGRGLDSDPLLTLAGLDVWWAGDPPTPSGTTAPPAPAPPPPTPPAPATPAPGPRRGWPGRR